MSPAQAWELKQRAMTLLEAALAPPIDDDMCPNCVTPWKCNGPHIAPGSAAALAQRKDEPVVWVDPLWLTSGGSPEDMFMEKAPHPSCEWVPLYTAAPAAPSYVPLSGHEILSLYDAHEDKLKGGGTLFHFDEFARAIESLVVARMRGEGK
jgi:hypothetical protein